MCGIFVSCGPNISFSNHERLTKLLYHRGPDNQKNLKINVKTYKVFKIDKNLNIITIHVYY